MGHFNVKQELDNVHKHYQSYENSMKSTDVGYQNAIANLYSLHIKVTEKLNDYPIKDQNVRYLSFN